MRKLSVTLGMLVALVVPAGLAGQDAEVPPTLRLSFHQCNLNEIGPAMEQIEGMELPIWEELVAEDMIASYGHFVHSWASEWNVGIYTVAADIEAVLAANAEFGTRMQERHPNADNGLNQVCPTHRDGFYLMGPRTGVDDEGSN